jgi:hypothetical protein
MWMAECALAAHVQRGPMQYKLESRDQRDRCQRPDSEHNKCIPNHFASVQAKCNAAPANDRRIGDQQGIRVEADHPLLGALGCLQQQVQAPWNGCWRRLEAMRRGAPRACIWGWSGQGLCYQGPYHQSYTPVDRPDAVRLASLLTHTPAVGGKIDAPPHPLAVLMRVKWQPPPPTVSRS